MWGVVTGLAAEARLLRSTPLEIVVGGGTPAGAARAAQFLVNRGAKVLISFGLAGGLNPTYQSGTLLIPRAILAGSTLYPCDPDLCKAFGGSTGDLLLGHESIASTSGEKSRLFKTTGAAAIDLESGAVATIAHAHGAKFAALRAVADPAWRTLPSVALNALDDQGKIKLHFILRELMRHPKTLPELLQLGADANRARQTLHAAVIQCRWESA